uniref:methyl-accepting chemotaxis protein n=1 Tax=Paenibacillus psychroresistens TaxID=1778678 RepID=UPI003866FB74
MEAARAGVHGKGFAVVANEVRNLTEQGKKSAKHIQETISVILAQTHNLVNVVNNTNMVNYNQKNAVSQISSCFLNREYLGCFRANDCFDG